MVVKNNFEYIDPISIYTASMPDSIKINEFISDEALLLRLLMGTLDMKITIDDSTSKNVKQRNNYLRLESIKYNSSVSSGGIKKILDSSNISSEILNKYLLNNRKNSSLYKKILMEFSMCFYYREKKEFLSEFIFIYRIVECIAYSFPLIYASKSGNFEKGFKDLKSFFSNEKDQGELNFFNRFMTTFLDNEMQNVNLELNLENYSIDLNEKAYNFNKLISPSKITELDEVNSKMKIKYKDSISFIISLRNRFFHNLLGSTNNQILMSDYSDLIEIYFKEFNEKFLNWISVIIFEITLYGIENE